LNFLADPEPDPEPGPVIDTLLVLARRKFRGEIFVAGGCSKSVLRLSHPIAALAAVPDALERLFPTKIRPSCFQERETAASLRKR
jgi:hypothetical protein